MTIVTSNRNRPRGELRDLIFQAAIAQFRRRGYAAATVDGIVADAGVAKGTFFNFFPSKLHVLAAYHAALDAEIAAHRRALDPRRPLASLSLYAASADEIYRREGALMLDLVDVSLSDRRLRDLDEDSGDIDAEDFADFFARAQAAGAIDAGVDPRLAAQVVGDLWSGAVRAWRRDAGNVSLAELFGPRLGFLCQALGAAE